MCDLVKFSFDNDGKTKANGWGKHKQTVSLFFPQLDQQVKPPRIREVEKEKFKWFIY